MLTSSRPTKRKTSSLEAATSSEPAFMIRRAPKNSPARSSAGSSCARPITTRPVNSSTSRAQKDSESLRATAAYMSVS